MRTLITAIEEAAAWLIAQCMHPWRKDILAAETAYCRELAEAALDAAYDADEQGAHEAAEYWRGAAAYWAARSA